MKWEGRSSEKGPFPLKNLDSLNRKYPGGPHGPQLWLLEKGPDSTTLNGHDPLDVLAFVFPAHRLTLDDVLALILYQTKIAAQVMACLPSDSICFCPFPCSTLYPSMWCLPAGVSQAQLAQKLLASDWVRQMGIPGKKEGRTRKFLLLFTSRSIASSNCVSSTLNRAGGKYSNSGAPPRLPRNLLLWHVNAQYICIFSSQL